MTSYKLKKLEKMMMKFESTVLSKRCMEIVMEINFDEPINAQNIPGSHIRNNKDLREYLELYFDRTLQNIN